MVWCGTNHSKGGAEDAALFGIVSWGNCLSGQVGGASSCVLRPGSLLMFGASSVARTGGVRYTKGALGEACVLQLGLPCAAYCICEAVNGWRGWHADFLFSSGGGPGSWSGDAANCCSLCHLGVCLLNASAAALVAGGCAN